MVAISFWVENTKKYEVASDLYDYFLIKLYLAFVVIDTMLAIL